MTTIVEYDKKVVECFNDMYDSIATDIPFNGKWRWQMSLRGALHDLGNKLKLDDGMIVKSTDDLGRKVIFMGTSMGVVVLYAYKLARSRTKIVYEVPEAFCEKSLFMRASDRLELAGLQYIFSALFNQAVQEAAVELKLAA